MSKYAIVTPTFEPHFDYVDIFLKSCEKFILDKDNVTIIFTISKNENLSFSKILKKYPDIKCKVVFFENLLQHFGIELSPNELLLKYKKFTFQTLKKFYTMLWADYDYFLILDSESMFVKETNIKNLFENFLSAPFVTGSNLSDREKLSVFSTNVNKNISFLTKVPKSKWFLENFVWFYDKKILQEMFAIWGSPIEMAEKIANLNNQTKIEAGIFEIELYQEYIYQNLDKYGYKFINADELLEKNLNNVELKKYLSSHNNKFKGNCGLLERCMSLIDRDNYLFFAEIFKNNSFNIIRCDETNIKNYKYQKKFLEIVQPNILAASQDHAFGVNNKFEKILLKNKYYFKIQKHFQTLKNVLNPIVALIKEPITIVFYSLVWLIKFPINLIRLIKD